MLTRTLREMLLDGSGAVLESKDVAVQADGEQRIDAAIAENGADVEIDVAFAKDALKLIVLVSDKALTIETNDGADPDDTITLEANKPLVWRYGGGLANPFTADVSKLYVSNGAVAASLRGYVLSDITP